MAAVMTMHAKRRVRKIYAYFIAQNALFSVPILVLYVQSYGLSLSDFLLLQSIYAVATLACEVPTGYISDRWQRHHILTFASVCSFLGTIGYFLGTGFWYFVLAELLLALGASLQSGTIESLLHETLVEEGQATQSRPVIRRLYFFQLLTQAIAATASGVIAARNLHLAVGAGLPFLGAAILLSIGIREPKRIRLHDSNHLRVFGGVWIQTIFRRPEMLGIIVVYSIIGTMTLCLLWLTQPYQEAAKLPLQFFGATQAIMLLGGAAAVHAMSWLEKRWRDRMLFIFLAIAVVFSYLLLGLPISFWGLLFLFTGRSVYGALAALTTDLINHMTESTIRATVLSIRAFAMRLLFAVVAPVIGYAADIVNLQTALMLTGAAGGILLLLCFASLRHIWNRIPDTKGSSNKESGILT